MNRLQNKPLVILISVLSIVLAVSAAVLLVHVTGAGDRPDKGSFDPYAKEGRLKGYEDREVPEGDSFHYLLSARPYFRSGAASGSISAENSPGNEYLMKVEYTLKDSGQVVYTSGFLKPGWHIASAPLDVALAKGIYPAIATITVLEDVTFEPLSTFTEDIQIFVGKKP